MITRNSFIMYRNKLWNNESKLAIGTLTTSFGNRVFDVACNIFLSSLSQSSSLFTAIYQSSETLIAVIINIFAGVFADKSQDKRKILILTDLACGLACLILSFLTSSVYAVYAIITVNIILSIFSTFNGPAAKSIIKFAIKKERIGKYNSYIKFWQQIIKVCSPILTLWLLAVGTIRVVIIFNAITFLLSAACERALVIENNDDKQNTHSSKKQIFFHDIKEALGYIFSQKEILLIISLASFVNFFISGYNLFLPYTYNFFNTDYNPYSLFISAEAVGGILGALLASRIKKQTINKMILFLFICGLSIFAIFISLELVFSLIMAIAAVAIFTVALTIFNIIFMTEIQTKVDDKYIGRVFSFIFTVALLFMPIGSFVFMRIFPADSAKSYFYIAVGICLTCLASYLINRLHLKIKD